MRGVIIKQLAVFTRFWWEIFTRFCAFFGVFLGVSGSCAHF